MNKLHFWLVKLYARHLKRREARLEKWSAKIEATTTEKQFTELCAISNPK